MAGRPEPADSLAKRAQSLPRNYYELFGLTIQASQEDIRQAYRRLCFLWHPDRHSDPADSAIVSTAFHHIQCAYAVLGDSALRSKYNASGHAQTATATPSALPIDTGNEFFQVERLATAYKTSLSLLQRLPKLETQFNLPAGSVELQVAGTHLATCSALDGSCQLMCAESGLDHGGLNACLCTTHKRLHQCNQHCTNKQTYCPLFARCIHQHWLNDVQSAWTVQVSETSDPERPEHPYWFNTRLGLSVWKEKDAEAEPDIRQRLHQCEQTTCSVAGFQHLLGRLWTCRSTGSLHICTASQCQHRVPLDTKTSAHELEGNADNYCWISGQIYSGEHALEGIAQGLTSSEQAALDAVRQLNPSLAMAGSDRHLIVSRQSRGNLLSPRGTDSQMSPTHSSGQASPLYESSLAYIEELEMSKQAVARQQEQTEQQRIRQLRRERQDTGVVRLQARHLAEEQGDNDDDGDNDDKIDITDAMVDNSEPPQADMIRAHDQVSTNSSTNSTASRSRHQGKGAASAAPRSLKREHQETDADLPDTDPSTLPQSKRTKPLPTIQHVERDRRRPLRNRASKLKRLKLGLVSSQLAALSNLVAPDTKAIGDGDEEETFYGEYVTAVLDKPDHTQEDVGDYETMEALDGGGREVIQEEDQDELHALQQAELEEYRLRSLEQQEQQCIEWTTDPTLGVDGGANNHGGVLRVYDGRVFQLVQERPPSPKTRPQALRAGRFELADTATRFEPHLPSAKRAKQDVDS